MVNTANIAAEPVDFQGDGRWKSMFLQTCSLNDCPTKGTRLGEIATLDSASHRHNRFVLQTKEREPEVLLIGDSIIIQMEHNVIWEKSFVPLHCLNFGIGGDATQHVLWRILNGSLENITPKVVVVQVGTNNHENTAAEIVEALLTIVEAIHKALPQASVLVLGLLPRGQHRNRIREKLTSVNEGLAVSISKHSSYASLLTFDPDMFVSPSTGEISDLDMYDYLHMTTAGYAKYSRPILDAIHGLLKGNAPATPTASAQK